MSKNPKRLSKTEQHRRSMQKMTAGHDKGMNLVQRMNLQRTMLFNKIRQTEIALKKLGITPEDLKKMMAAKSATTKAVNDGPVRTDVEACFDDSDGQHTPEKTNAVIDTGVPGHPAPIEFLQDIPNK